MPDYAIIFGARVRRGRPSPTLQHRIDGALTWARRHPDALFMPTGGIGEEGEAEAEVIARTLIEAGVGADRIVIEPHGRDTLESVRFCDSILRDRGDCQRVICCTSTFHQPRCALLLRVLGYRVVVPPIPNGWKRLAVKSYAVSVAKEIVATPYDAALLIARRAVRAR